MCKKGQRISHSLSFCRRGELRRPRAFTERPYEDDFLSVGKTCFTEDAPCSSFSVGAGNRTFCFAALSGKFVLTNSVRHLRGKPTNVAATNTSGVGQFLRADHSDQQKKRSVWRTCDKAGTPFILSVDIFNWN